MGARKTVPKKSKTSKTSKKGKTSKTSKKGKKGKKPAGATRVAQKKAPPHARPSTKKKAAARARGKSDATTNVEDPGGTVLDADAVRARYAGAWWLEVLEYGKHPPPVRVIESTVEVASLTPGQKPWGIVIEGDLIATGDLDFSTGDYAVSLLVVRGSLRARNLRFTNGANCVIERDCDVEGVVLGRYGDESARLAVGGQLRARALLLDHVTGCEARTIDAVVMSSPGWGLPMDVEEDTHGDVFVAAALDRGDFSAHHAWTLATKGTDVFRPGVYARLRAARPGPFVRPPHEDEDDDE